jgi:hypothetical protein
MSLASSIYSSTATTTSILGGQKIDGNTPIVFVSLSLFPMFLSHFMSLSLRALLLSSPVSHGKDEWNFCSQHAKLNQTPLPSSTQILNPPPTENSLYCPHHFELLGPHPFKQC